MGKLELTCHLLVNCNIAAVDTEYAAPPLSLQPPPSSLANLTRNKSAYGAVPVLSLYWRTLGKK